MWLSVTVEFGRFALCSAYSCAGHGLAFNENNGSCVSAPACLMYVMFFRPIALAGDDPFWLAHTIQSDKYKNLLFPAFCWFNFA